MPDTPLIGISLWSQRFNGIMLPVVLVCMMLIVNDTEIMDTHTNKKVMNILGWITIVLLIGLSVTMVVTSLL